MGSTVTVSLQGDLTQFVQGATIADFGPGITVGAGNGLVTVNSPTSATVQVQIGAQAAPGPRQIVISTGGHRSSTTFQVLSSGSGPVANAGPQQFASVGSTVELDGSHSTYVSSNGNSCLLGFQWSFLSFPAGSLAQLSDPASMNPRFTIDQAGDYILQLSAQDGSCTQAANPANTAALAASGAGSPSTLASVVISTLGDTSPVANAGPSQWVALHSKVQLDGSQSSNADGDPLTYQWSFLSMPEGSAATLSDSTSVAPTFVADVAGKYQVQLTANDGQGNSASDTVVISTDKADVPPLADAGSNQQVPVKSTAQLDGSQSSAADPNDTLTYAWSFTFKPSTSVAQLKGADTAKPSFTVDMAGTYGMQLVVTEGGVSSTPATVMISTDSIRPVAVAGPAQALPVGSTVHLDGSGSTEAPTNYQWSLLSKPLGSSAELSDTTQVKPTFVADLPGIYVAQLIVSNGLLTSYPSTVRINATTPGFQAQPTAVVFPNQMVGGTSSSLPVSIANTGTGNLVISGLTIGGANPGDFGHTTATLPLTVLPDNTTIVNLTFTPAVIGSRTATLTINDNAGGPHTLALSGIGTVGPPASITASAGSGQSALTHTSFATPLQAMVKDAGGNPVSGVTVTFAAPATGSSGTFAGGTNTTTVTTNTQGMAMAPTFTANGIGGPFTVTVSATGVATPAVFSLGNVMPVLLSLALTPTTPTIGIGQTLQFQATGTFSDYSTANLTSQVSWSSGSSSVATITSSGIVTGGTLGAAFITAAMNGISGTAVLTVVGDPPSSYTLFGTAVPPATNVDAGVPLELGMKFTADRDGAITALRFYKGAGNSGPHQGNLWSSTGQLLATATFTNETDSGWQQVNLATPVPITANTVYVVSYHTPGGYSATYGDFNGPVDNPPLHAVVNSASSGNGVYAYGSNSDFPTNSGLGANYQLDVAFRPSTGTTPLMSLMVSPANQSIAIGSTQQLQVTGTFADNSSADLTSQVSWSSDTPSVATITSGGMATGVSIGSAVVTATLAGISGTATLMVTPAPLPPFSHSLFSNVAVPPATNVDAGVPIELGMKFTADRDGAITGLRFYKAAGNSGPHVGHLWSSTGQLLASATFANETDSGWQQVNLTTPVAITANTVYVVSYYTPANYSVTFDYFNVAVDYPPLHAVVNGASNGDGVYAYGMGNVYPTGSGLGANYWVDVAFISSSDTAPLVSLAVTPASPSIEAGATQQFQAIGTSLDNGTADLTSRVSWSSDSPSVAMISSVGLATGGNVGTSLITATLDGLSGTAALTVTSSPLDPDYSLFSNSAVPTVPNVNAGVSIELGMKFTADRDGTITALRFYKGSGNSGPHVGNLWSRTGQLLATATFTNETYSGWQQVNLSTPVPITANTVYVVSYHTPKGYSASYGYFNAAVDNPPLHAVVNSASSGNGVYAYGSNSVFPTNSGSGTNFWVDVVFATTTGTSPLVSLAITPVSPSIGIGSTQQFQAIGTFADNSTADLTSHAVWFSASPAVATITGGGLATGVIAGTSLITATLNAISGAATLTITPPPPPSSSSTLFSSSAVPDVAYVSSSKPIELGMKFTADRDGSITALRFYKGAGNSGPHAGNLWNSTGKLLATATFTNETDSGWQQVNLATPVAITANTTYVVSYHTPAGYSTSYGYFNAAVDNAPLHAPASSASNGNGLYAYGANSVFPTGNGFGANYWVDVVFTPAGTNTGSLVSLAVTPANPSIGVGSTQQFRAMGTFTDNSTADLTSQVSWNSGSPSVATITSGGLATGATVGSSIITAALNGISSTATLTVAHASLVSLAVSPASPSIAAGSTQQFQATGTFADNSSTDLTSQVSWNSGSPSVATITSGGLATGATVGSSIITAALNGISSTATLTVAHASLVSLAVTPATPSIATGSTQQFQATGTFSDNSSTDLTSQVSWASGSPLVATLTSGGLATGATAGSSIITAALNGINGTATLTVTGPSLVSLAVTPASPSIVTGSTQQFQAIGTFADNSTKDLTSQVSWASGSPSVATLTSGGLATGATVGSSVITAALNGVSGTATLTVTSPPPSYYSFTLFNSSAVPDVPYVNAGVSIELGMKFTADRNGAISALRFYKGAGNSGPHVGNLWSSTGQLLATATFTNETNSGWQQVNLATPVAITANTVYVVSYHTPKGYSASFSYFNTAVDNAPLHALLSSASNGNGVYAYGSRSVFPTGNGLGTNYWLDVVFTNQAGVPTSIAATAGSGQSIGSDLPFPIALQATVKDAGGVPVNGAVVTFTAPSGSGASGTFAGGGTTTTASTNAQGIASAAFTANSTIGTYTVTASVAGLTARFSLANQLGQPTTIVPTAGMGQTVVVSTAFAPLQVVVKDAGANLVSGSPVTFTAQAADNGASGTFTGGGNTATVNTNAQGIATAPTFTANATKGEYTVTASAGNATANFSLANIGPPTVTPTAGSGQSTSVGTSFATALQVTATDDLSNLMSGATVTFTATSVNGASGTFAGGGNTATAITNAQGVATAPVFTANGNGGQYTVTASVPGVIVSAIFTLTNLVPVIGMSPASVSFADQMLGYGGSAPTAVVINNTGAGNLLISNLTITGQNPADFSFTSGTLPITVNPNSSTTVNVTFTPQMTGGRAAALTISDNASGSPHLVPLSGNGTGAILAISPASVNFGNQNVNSASAPLPVTISNGSLANANLVISSLQITGPNAAEFALSAGTLPITVAPNSSTTLNLTFTPTTSGIRSASLVMNDNDKLYQGGSPHTIPLTGNGIAPGISVPASIIFPSQIIYTTSPARNVSVTNTGTGNLVIYAVAITGANASEFAYNGAQQFTISPTGSNSLPVTFTPTGSGLRSATLTISDNVNGGTQQNPHIDNVALSGTGLSQINFVVPPVSVGANLEVPVTVGLNAPAASNLPVTITSPDSSKVLLSLDPTLAGTDNGGTSSVPITILQGTLGNPFARVYVQSLDVPTGATPDTIQLTVTAPGYAPLPVTVTLTPSVLVLNGGNGYGQNFSTQTLSVPLTLTAYGLDSSSNIAGSPQMIRGGLSLSVNVSSADTTIGTISGNPATLAGGTSSVSSLSFQPVAVGNTLLTVTQPSGFSTQASGGHLTATVGQPQILLTPTTVGYQLQVPGQGQLSDPAPTGGLEVTIKSDTPGTVLLSTNATAAGSNSIILTVPEGTTALPAFYVQGVAIGSGQLEASASNYGFNQVQNNGVVTVQHSTFLLAGPSGVPGQAFSTTAYSTTLDTPLLLTAWQLNPMQQEQIAGGVTVPVSVTSNDPTVGTILGGPVTFHGGDFSNATLYFHPLKQGTSVLSVAPPAPFTGGQLTATVGPPQITLNMPAGSTIGDSLELYATGSLNTAAPSGGLSITITSSNPLVVLSNSATQAGSSSILVTVNAGYGLNGMRFPQFYVQSLATSGSGSATLTASATGWGSGTITVTLAPSGFVLVSPLGMGQDFATNRVSGNTQLTVQAMQLDATGAPQTIQALAGGLSASVSVSSGALGVGTIVNSPVTISGGSGSGTVSFQPVGSGICPLTVSPPAGAGYVTPSSGYTLSAHVK